MVVRINGGFELDVDETDLLNAVELACRFESRGLWL
jgi:hypothetical protein